METFCDTANPAPRVRRMATTLAAVLALVVGSACVLTGAFASAGIATVAAATTAPAMSCADVAKLDLSGIEEAPTQIASATELAATDNPLGDRAACEVKGLMPRRSSSP